MLLALAFSVAVHTVFTQVNEERRGQGIPSLSLDDCLTAIANERADDMLRRNYFSHVTPDGRLPIDYMRADGCPFRYAGENIAEAPDPLFAVTELWNSPEHRRNTLDSHYHRVGIGASIRPDGTEIIVEDFTD
ncbi:MAG TPA: CAP domain-containing protein [Verrucomicrobiae bacterium]|nr:CAP domain-containing protein [Verrucomicrobiae bacterium]